MGNITRLTEDASILGTRIREARERAGYKTLGKLWQAIRKRGCNITRQYLYQLEHGKQTASIEKMTMILDACGLSMSEFLGIDLMIGPSANSDIQQRKFVTMLTKIREINPPLARVVEGTILRAYKEALKQSERPESARGPSKGSASKA